MPVAWDAFYSAQLGASAALTGLLFVGLSINMSKIVAVPALPSRALQALVLLGSVLVLSTLALVPGQSTVQLAGELAGLGAVASGLVARVEYRTLADIQAPYRRGARIEAAAALGATSIFLIAGVLVALVGADGLYLAVAGVLVCYVIAIVDAWVLLVEINR